MKSVVMCLFLMIVLLPGLGSPSSLHAESLTPMPPIPKTKPLIPDLDKLAKAYMDQKGHDTGIAVGVIEVVNGGPARYSSGFYGTVSSDSKQAPTDITLFEIGSNSKVYTAVLLAFFVDEGKVKLDDPIQKYLPRNVHAPTYQGKAITLRDLATHRSGLPDTPDNKPRDEKKPYSVDDMYTWLSSYK